MFNLMTILLAVFLIGVYHVTRNAVFEMEKEITKEVFSLNEVYRRLLVWKDELSQRRRTIEQEEADIFMLYELTKEMNKETHEQETFEIFRDKLRECVRFESCEFIDDVDETPQGEGAGRMVFRLQSKQKNLGFVTLTGVDQAEKEKAKILCDQFALVLRRIRLYKEIEQLAMLDGLTGVFTRRYFLDRFREELERSKAKKIEFALLMMDVDHFKSINDRYGHLTGDQVLKETGHLIKNNIREIDIAGRYGGEEFGVILPDTDLDGANFAAERIRAAMENADIKAYDLTIKTTISIGIVTFPKGGQSVEELIDKGDWALYRAKKNGRNRICSFGIYNKGASSA